MEKKSSMNKLSKPIGALFRRFHLTLFFVLIVACLASAVLLINNTLDTTAEERGYVSPINAGTIDQATLERVQQLHTSADDTSFPDIPEGRTNPFGE